MVPPPTVHLNHLTLQSNTILSKSVLFYFDLINSELPQLTPSPTSQSSSFSSPSFQSRSEEQPVPTDTVVGGEDRTDVGTNLEGGEEEGKGKEGEAGEGDNGEVEGGVDVDVEQLRRMTMTPPTVRTSLAAILAGWSERRRIQEDKERADRARLRAVAGGGGVGVGEHRLLAARLRVLAETIEEPLPFIP
mmetsp:Transcript_14744/g.46279  ORF Transcript_14744/g.46279 Transcript_14744/m.46279 type:complete len:190 (-) Transcript_14744:85-654(-)